MLIRVGCLLALAGIVLCLVGVYLAAWPLRRLATRTPAGARLQAAQELLVALAGVAAVARRGD